MILNSRNSNFTFSFPRGFFLSDLEDKYTPYIKRLPLPWDNLTDYMNAQVQSISMPSLNMQTVSQVRTRGKTQVYKSGQPVPDYFSKEMVVTMRALDGYINYWIFLENTLNFLDLSTPALYDEDLYVRVMDQEGYVIQTIRFQKPMITNVSEITLSYSDNDPTIHTFTATFTYNALEIMVERD